MNKIIHSVIDTNPLHDDHKIQKAMLMDFSSAYGIDNSKKIISPTQILDDAAKQAEKIRKDAYKVGLDEGLKKAEEINKKNISSLVGLLKNVCLGIENKQETILKNTEPQVLEMILQISQKIIQCKLEINKDAMMNILSGLLKKINDKTEIIVKVSPDDYKLLNQNKKILLEEISTIKNLTFEENSQLTNGDFIIDTKKELIDARIDAQINELRSALEIF
ncbi:MAG: hypothetical protein HY934_00840 [Candidatus Firestonebacteria bacterium]|nr:hypothetical protein [Candidatus Firestonebacteria bacterium]